MIRARRFRRLFLSCAAGGTLLWPAAAGLRAQTGGPAETLSLQGNAAFDRRDYQGAAAAYTSLLQGYPNSEFSPDAQFHLAYADFLLGRFPPAADLLHKLQTTASTPPEMQEDVALLLPQVLAQQATGETATAARVSGFQAAIREYGNFINKFGRSASLEAALYGRAVAEYQITDYAGAARDLNRNLTDFPRSETVLDSEFLLAITVATQANLTLAKEETDAAGRAAALQNYEAAARYLRDIITRNTDISLANEAQFQLGETLLAQAGSSPAAAQPKLYQDALAAYRAVEPKAPMLAAETARVERLSEALLTERRKGAAADRALIRQLDQARLREAGKLGALQAKADPVLTARLKAGAVFYDLERYDETRLLMSALLPEAAQPDDQKLARYYIALTYAAQKQVDKAVAAYDKFQAAFAGDAMAENLPLVIGNLFLGAPRPDADKANHYFDEFTRLYPKSRLRETALLEQASASASLGHYDDALRTLDTFLQGHPKRELAAAAELTLSGVYRDQGDLPKALAAYTRVRDTYKDRPEGQQAAFWVGYVLAQNHDAAGSLKILPAFIAQYPQSPLVPLALSTIGLDQQATGAKEQALATFAEVSKRFSDSPEGSTAYFQRANIYLNDRKFDDMARVLGDFVSQHPQSEQAFAAYDRIASVQLQGNQSAAAAATYQKFLASQPDSPHAPEALARVAALWLRAARSLGTYVVLGAPQRETWNADIANSVAASEQQLARYPDAPATALGLQTLLDCQRLLITAQKKTSAEVAAYFQDLAAKNQNQPAARSRILFRLASLTAETDPAKALADMRAAYDPAVVYSPADLDLYTRELLPADPAAAAEVFAKLAHDYPIPAGLTPAQAPADVQEAQAIVLCGRGQSAQAAGNLPAALAAFSELKQNYPRSPKIPEADLGLAEGLIANGKTDDALPLLAEVARSPSAPVNARARALFLNGKVQQAKGSDGAIDAYLKVAAFYPSSPDAAEGLWLGGQALEKQAPGLSDTPAKPGGPTKSGQLARARKAYQDLVTHYGASKWVDQARQRLAALPLPAQAS